MSGRNIYIVDLGAVIAASGRAAFLRRAEEAQLSAVWIRVGRGEKADANLTHSDLPLIRAVLKAEGIDVWGWHVPFCANPAAARREASLALQWVEAARLDGLVVDAERTPESPRFQGSALEADIYASALASGLHALDKPIALSSHDQPARHTDLPWHAFLKHIEDVCPQVYYRSHDVSARLQKSEQDFRALLPAESFVGRYKPTGNITISDDMSHTSVEACLNSAEHFTQLVKERGYFAHGFWCWDAAPPEIWRFFRDNAA